MARALVCAEADFDPQAQTCAAPQWVEQQPGLLPSLSVADAAELFGAIAVCWAIGFGWREVRRSLGAVHEKEE